MNEFDLIEKYFKPLSKERVEAGGFENDAAVLDIPDGFQLVVSSDISAAGVHFLEDQSSETVAKKALRRNISDLIAMGAKPYCYQMCLALPELDEEWLSNFVKGLAEDQERYGIFLSGGDTSSTPGPLSISITVMGLVKQGQALKRSGARDGDLIVLSGTVGDAYCGLKALQTGIDAPEMAALTRVPEPPAALIEAAGKYARAAIDISDGLVQDLGHVCRASGVGAELDLDQMRFSSGVQGWLDEKRVSFEDVLTGGDDYQLLMAVAPEDLMVFQKEIRGMPVDLQVIGRFRAGTDGVSVLRNGSLQKFTKTGWRHFN